MICYQKTPWLLCLVTLLGACAPEDNTPLIGSLDDREYQLENLEPPQVTREEVVKKYREFIDYATGEPMYGNAIRRLADIELETAEQDNTTSEEQTAINRRKMEAAIRMYEVYLETYPHRENIDLILYQLAKAYDLVGDYLGTLTTLNRLVTHYPDSRHYIESQFRRGEMLFALGRYNESEQAYQKIVTQTETSIFREKAMFKYGWALFKQNKYSPALHAFFAIIDEKHRLGLVTESDFSNDMALAEQELLEDAFRAVSLSFSYLDGASGVQAYFADNGHRRYEPLVYRQLAHTYLSKDRFSDAAETYLAFGQHYPDSELAPEMHQQAIEVYKKGKLPTLQLASRVSFVERYGVFGQYWQNHNDTVRDRLKPLLQNHLRDLAQHHHALGRKAKDREDKSGYYTQAVTWYRTYIKSFPGEPDSAEVNFLLAEAYNDIGHYTRAITEFETTAYHYPTHTRQAEAGYAALLAYAMLLKQNEKRPEAKPGITRDNIESALRFGNTFPQDPRVTSVLTHTAEQLFEIKDYPRATTTAQVVIDSPHHTEQQVLTAYTVIAHSQFELQDYAAAELAYQQTLALLPAKSPEVKALQDKLAASIYKQGEQSRQQGQLALAAQHFMRLGTVLPDSPIRATAEYDAATLYIEQQDWASAEKVLLEFRDRYPKDKQYQLGVAEKLALVYSKTGQPLLAAGEMERLAVLPGKPLGYRQDMLWQAAGLYQDGGQRADAARLYQEYVKLFPDKYPESIEARFQLADYYKEAKQPQQQVHWLKETINAERQAGKDGTERTRYLAAQSTLALAYPLMTHYRKTALVIPLNKSLKRKKDLMEKTIKAYENAMKYRVADVTTSATYHIAEIYHDFSRALLESQRPKGLSPEELEQYDTLLEEQAFPFEEKAITIHSSNVKHTQTGVYDQWIKQSLKQLSQLQPIRYAKTEKGEDYAEDLQ